MMHAAPGLGSARARVCVHVAKLATMRLVRVIHTGCNSWCTCARRMEYTHTRKCARMYVRTACVPKLECNWERCALEIVYVREKWKVWRQDFPHATAKFLEFRSVREIFQIFLPPEFQINPRIFVDSVYTNDHGSTISTILEATATSCALRVQMCRR